ncbi:MAG: phosphoribosyltransferase family protein [Muribaculaceae bacterium]|nr:phosphoribosyltransferase family protein [Muribaculaceae bacterium]
MNIKDIRQCFIDLLFPRSCPVCGTTLGYQEPYICIGCMTDIPLTRFNEIEFNKAEQLFAGKVEIEHASSLFFYTKSSPYANILHDIKYRNRPPMAEWLAWKLTLPIASTNYFDGIDYIIPIPLHYTKKGERGYNQSEYVAQGISRATGIEMKTYLKARIPHATQTHKGLYERWQNTLDIFEIAASESLEGKHILIVDDVITTGSTLVSAAKEFKSKYKDIKISAFSLAAAQL